jgi:hypothetical protein
VSEIRRFSSAIVGIGGGGEEESKIGREIELSRERRGQLGSGVEGLRGCFGPHKEGVGER